MKVTSAKSLACAMRDWRKRNQLTQETVSNLVGIKQATVSNFENNPDKTQLDTLFKLLSALNLELHITERNAKKVQSSDGMKNGD